MRESDFGLVLIKISSIEPSPRESSGRDTVLFRKIDVRFPYRILMNEIMCDLETIVVVKELSRRE